MLRACDTLPPKKRVSRIPLKNDEVLTQGVTGRTKPPDLHFVGSAVPRLKPWVHYVPLSLKGNEYVESMRYFTSEEEGKKEDSDLVDKAVAMQESVEPPAKSVAVDVD
jgi:hypothetical protein